MATTSRRARVVIAALSAVTCVGLTWSFVTFHKPQPVIRDPRIGDPRVDDFDSSAFESAAPAICKGPRGGLLDDPETQDLPHPVTSLPNVTFPQTTMGSYEALGLEQSWLTMDQRFGPYGYGEDSENYTFSKVDWESISWGSLQDECFQANQHRFGSGSLHLRNVPRFRFDPKQEPRRSKKGKHTPRSKTGRQAIILRSWSTFEYQPEDFWNIRAMISEASLATGGEYTVILLVDVKSEDGAMIHQDDALYRKMLEQIVPREFWDIAVLFHESLQESWYEKVGEYKTIWQVMQPLQLVAHFYPEFDHYWQFEMDTRFTGSVGEMLKAFHSFGKKQPYKQARERASWTYIPRVHGTYEEFSTHLNRTMEGDAAWGPIDVADVKPVGQRLPVDDPKDDDFEVGVDQDADLLLLGPLYDVGRIQTVDDWVFKDWYSGDSHDPRFMSVPAQARASQELLEAIHDAQHSAGIYMPSEATLPTFALWHGLKLVGVPAPKFQFPERNVEEMNFVFNGGMPRDFRDGIANGAATYRSKSVSFFVRPLTFAWWSNLCDLVFESWMNGLKDEKRTNKVWAAYGDKLTVPENIPGFMEEVDGKVYAPSFIMHPRKTNVFRAPEG